MPNPYLEPDAPDTTTAVADNPYLDSADATPQQSGNPYLQPDSPASTTPATDAATKYGSSGPTTAEIAGMTAPEWAQKVATGVVENVKPFIEHPLQSAYNTVVPNMEDVRNVGKLFTGEAYQERTPIGSQEYYTNVVGNAIPLALMGAGKALGGFKGKPAAVEAEMRPAEAPIAEAAPVPPENLQGVAGPETTAPPEEVTPSDASNQPETTGVPVRDQGGGVGEGPPLRQQGETADVPPQGDGTGSEAQQAPETPVSPTDAAAVESAPQGAEPVPTEAQPADTVPPADVNPEPVGVTHEAIDLEGEARGLDPIEKQASRNLGDTWVNVAERTANDPNAPRRLAEQLKDKPRALNDDDVALLLRRRVETRTEFDNAVREVNESANDPQALAEAKNRLEQARADYDQTRQAVKNSSSETGRGLRALQQMAFEDYSLARMESVRRAANDGRPLTPRQAVETQQLHAKIAELESKLNINEKIKQQADLETEFKKLMGQSRKGARESAKAGNKVTSFLDDQAARARARIVERRTKLHAGYDPTAILDEAIIGASHIARGLTDFAQWSKTMLKDVGEHIRPYLQDLYNRAKALHADSAKAFADRQEARLKAYKKGVITRTEAVREKLAAGDLTKAERAKTKLDAEAFNLRAEYQRVKNEFDIAVHRDQLMRRSFGRKAADFAVKAERSMKLTGIKTLGKLGGAGVTRLVTTPTELVLQTVMRAVPYLRTVAKAAQAERGLSFKGEAAAIRGVGTGIKQIPSIIKGIPTAHEVLYGKANLPAGSKLETALDVPQNIHASIKAPFKESQRARVEVNLQNWAQEHGMDVNHPEVKQALGELADQSAKRAIFMQDNFVSDWWRNGIRALEHSKKAPTAGYIASKIGQFLLPIVKVPTNVAFEAMTHVGGLGTGTIKLMGVMKRGLENIKPEEADFIMRHYSKGMIGAGMFFLGYFNAKNVGGFFTPHDKRDPNDVRWGAARIAGVNVPSWLLHAPAFIVMQAGATTYRIQHKMEKGEEKGKVAGTVAAAKGLLDEIPFVREMGFLDNVLADGYEGMKARGQLAASTVTPQGVKNIAEWTDPLKEPQYRAPKSEVDYIKMGWPILREQVGEHVSSSKPIPAGGRPHTSGSRIKKPHMAGQR